MRHTWADAHPLLTTYYENEWQIESHDDRYLFEMLVLTRRNAGGIIVAHDIKAQRSDAPCFREL